MKLKEQSKLFQTSIAERLAVTVEKVVIKVFDNTSSVQYTLEEFIDQYNPEDIQKGQAHFVFGITVGESIIGRFMLQDMVNCSGIIVNSDVYVGKKYLNRGIGTLINLFCIDFCKYYGYGIIQATDKEDNKYQKQIFEKNGWQLITAFQNPKTHNLLNIWMYLLSEK